MGIKMNNLRIRKIKIVWPLAIFGAIICLPFLASAAGLVPCGGPAPEEPCKFADLVTMGHRIINFLIYDFSMPFATVLLIWAGFLFMFQSSDPGTLAKAKNMFWSVVVGFVVALAAFIIIKLVLVSLGADIPTQLSG